MGSVGYECVHVLINNRAKMILKGKVMNWKRGHWRTGYKLSAVEQNLNPRELLVMTFVRFIADLFLFLFY